MVIERRCAGGAPAGSRWRPCGAVADFDHGDRQFTMHMNSSFNNYVGWPLAATLGVPANKLDILPVPAGGSFGSKLFCTRRR